MIRLAVRAPAAAAEPVLAALLEHSPAGVEQVDGEGFVEYALYGAAGELPALPPGEAEVGGVIVAVSAAEVDDDWADRWRRFHRPVVVAGRLGLRPPWELPARTPGTIDLVIDPGRAFGTGAHPTTRLCLELLVDVEGGGSLADLGCGSGVVAIAAAKLGHRPVAAFDSDREALTAARANARANGVTLARIERLDLRQHAAPAATTIVANLTAPLLLRVAELMPQRPRTLIVSGVLDAEADEVAAVFGPLRERRRLSVEGWSAALLERR